MHLAADDQVNGPSIAVMVSLQAEYRQRPYADGHLVAGDQFPEGGTSR